VPPEPTSPYADLRPFIVHGHDHALRDDLRNLLIELGTQSPIVLDGQANVGQTIIEKFESESDRCNLAVVLITPDDQVVMPGGAEYASARPNVWIELGYFLAKFGRKSGRVILVYKKPVQIPSDLQGILYIDATGGLSGLVRERIEGELNGIVTQGELTQTRSAAFPAAGTDYAVRGRLFIVPDRA
jgi:predicted nucleotide-binding protein